MAAAQGIPELGVTKIKIDTVKVWALKSKLNTI
jgi:hypothetical protein